jgi:hypothetical protein
MRSIMAIFQGLLTFAGLIFVCFSFIYIFVDYTGAPTTYSSNRIEEFLTLFREYDLLLPLLFFTCVLISGYVCGKGVDSNRVTISGVVSLFIVLFALVAMRSLDIAISWSRIVVILLTLPTAVLGGFLATRRAAESGASSRRHFRRSVLAFLVLILLCLAYFFGTDERLSPEAKKWLDKEESVIDPESNVYFALMGLFAAAADDPHRVGMERVKAYRRARLTKKASHEEAVFEDYPRSKRFGIKKDDIEALAKVTGPSFLLELFDNEAVIRGLAVKYRVLLDRYRELYEYEYFKSELHERIVDTTLLFKRMNTLNANEIALEYTTGSKKEAIQALANDVEFLRFLLAEGDQVILKMTVASCLARDLHLYAQLLDAEDVVHEDLAALGVWLTRLSGEERSLARAIRGEFQVAAKRYLEIDSPQLFKEEFQLERTVPSWFARIFYKPNATVNLCYGWYKSMADLAHLDARSFEERRDRVQIQQPDFLSFLRNVHGSTIAWISTPDFGAFVAEMHDVDGIIRLAQLKSIIRMQNTDEQQISGFLLENSLEFSNPYTGDPIRWNPDRKVIYYEGPAGCKSKNRELALRF